MIVLTLAEITDAVDGQLILGDSGATAETVVDGPAQTDSREVTPGSIFFARRGEETDGHRFITAAVAAGAELIVAEHASEVAVPQILVADTTDALGALAGSVVAAVNAKGHLTIVGITGSNGKTTTKNLVAAITERAGLSTVASEKSFNNEVGGPLTMLRVTDQTETLIAEMGASAEGEIARLTALAPPHIGVVLSVGLAHAGGFGGIETTVRTKSEMVRDLPETAVAVLNRDDPRVAQMAQLTRARVRWFGQHTDATVRAEQVVSGADGTRFTLRVDDATAEIHFPVLGEHHVANALAAAAVATELGLPITVIAEALAATVVAAPGRMQVLGGRDQITIINDAYNASPDSMSAALRTLAQIRLPEGRSVAVLGAMSELGDLTIEEHLRIGLQVVRLGISELVVVGNEARNLHISAINEGSWDGESVFFESIPEAFDYLTSTLRPNDTVMVKSSNAAGLQQLGDQLGAHFA